MLLNLNLMYLNLQFVLIILLFIISVPLLCCSFNTQLSLYCYFFLISLPIQVSYLFGSNLFIYFISLRIVHNQRLSVRWMIAGIDLLILYLSWFMIVISGLLLSFIQWFVVLTYKIVIPSLTCMFFQLCSLAAVLYFIML